MKGGLTDDDERLRRLNQTSPLVGGRCSWSSANVSLTTSSRVPCSSNQARMSVICGIQTRNQEDGNSGVRWHSIHPFTNPSLLDTLVPQFLIDNTKRQSIPIPSFISLVPSWPRRSRQRWISAKVRKGEKMTCDTFLLATSDGLTN